MSEPSGAPPEGSTSPTPAPREEPSSPGEDTATGSPSIESPPTNLAKLRKSYEDARQDRRETIPIAPGIYGGNLAARYRPIEWSDTRKKLAKLQRRGATDEQALDFAAVQLAKACEMILFRPEDGKDYVPLHESAPGLAGGQPIRYDERLAKAIGIPLDGSKSAKEIVRLVFIDPNVLDSHFVEFDFWLRGLTSGETDDDDEDLAERPT